MRSYPLYDLHANEFEDLVTLLCDRILGIGTINFSEGKDGGRDGIFSGRANCFPSKSEPWEGKFVIQAKHTSKVNASCSDSDFATLLKKEVKNKVFKSQDNGKIDYYLLFTNRKLSGLKDEKISDFLDIELKIPNRIFGEERIQLWLREFPDITKTLHLDRLLLPIQFYDDDIRKVIITFSNYKQKIIDHAKVRFNYQGMERKNQLNDLSRDYFEFMKTNSLVFFDQIDRFLKDPANWKYKIKYDNTVSDLQEQIIIKRNDYNTFDELFNAMYEFILANNKEELKDSRKLIRVFLHYMYFKCDIGRSE